MLALYPRRELAKDAGVRDSASSSVEFSLGYIAESKSAVDKLLARGCSGRQPNGASPSPALGHLLGLLSRPGRSLVGDHLESEGRVHGVSDVLRAGEVFDPRERSTEANCSLSYLAMSPDQPRIVRAPISRSELKTLAASRFGDLVKAVVDVARGVMAVSGELHSDEEALLLDDGSRQRDLWGINLYPAETGEDWIEFDSVINVRPSQNNRSRSVEDETTRTAIRRVVRALVADA